jgi:hypothetical protein
MTGRNCERLVGDAVRSVADQNYRHLDVLYVDDASEDGSYAAAVAALSNGLPRRHAMVRNGERRGKAFNASRHLRSAAVQYDIVAVVDADDQLIDPDVIGKLVACYQAGRDVVWTDYVTDLGRLGNNASLNPALSPRAQRWSTGHLFSFRAALLANVPEHYFQHENGQWLDAACDVAIALPLLDQTRRYEFLPIRAYRYTETNPQSHHDRAGERQALSSPMQRRCAAVVASKAPLPRIDIMKVPPNPSAKNDAPASAPGQAFTQAQSWEPAAASYLATLVPSLLEQVTVDQIAHLDPMLGLSWLQRLRRRPASNILALGYGNNTAMLECLAQHQAASLTVVVPDDKATEAVSHRTALMRAPWAEYEIDGGRCYLPQLDVQTAEAPYDMVLVDASAWGASRSPIIAMAALAPHMDLEHFDVWMLGLSEAELASARQDLSDNLPMATVKTASRGVLHIRG